MTRLKFHAATQQDEPRKATAEDSALQSCCCGQKVNSAPHPALTKSAMLQRPGKT